MGSNNDGSVAGGERAPLLRGAGGYPAWKPAMNVYLQRHGAAGVHTEPLSEVEWLQDCSDVAAWGQQTLAAARAAARGGMALSTQETSGSSTSSTGIDEVSLKSKGGLAAVDTLTAEAKAARTLVAANVERSHKAFGSIYSALPEELRLQVQHIPQGWAYGLWQWLERKFQSTEADNVGTLLLRWVHLAQKEGESFDSYRARVNELAALLEHAKQKQTPEMYCLFLLDRLQPRYTPVVLALKNGTLLKDKSAIDWDAVTVQINAHERDVIRKQSEEAVVAEAKAMAARAASSAAVPPQQRGHSPSPDQRRDGGHVHGGGGRDHGSGSRSRGLQEMQCYNCGKFGHIQRNCTRKSSNGGQGGGGTAGVAGGKREEQASSARTTTPGAEGNRQEVSYAAVVASGLPKSCPPSRLSCGTRGPVTSVDSDGYTEVSYKKRFKMSKEAPPQNDGSAAGAGAQRREVRPPVSNVAPVRESGRVSEDSKDKDGQPRVALKRPESEGMFSSSGTPTTLAAPTATSANGLPASSGKSNLTAKSDRKSAETTAAAQTGSSKIKLASKRNVRFATKRQTQMINAKNKAMIEAKAMAATAGPREKGIDSMASVSVDGNKESFIPGSLRPCKPFVVKMADNGEVVVNQVGSVELTVNVSTGQTVSFVIENVYYHPRFGASLLSLHSLTENGWSFFSSKEGTYLLTPDDKLKIQLQQEQRVSILRCVNAVDMKSADQRVFRVYQVGDLVWDSAADLVHLHQRLGHMGFDRMIRIIKEGATTGLGKLNMSAAVLQEARKRVLECRACTRGKGTRTPFGHRGLDKGSSPCETLHMDTYFVKYKRADGTWNVEYGLTVSDPYTTWRWHARLDSKDLVADTVVKVIRTAQTQFGVRVKRLHTDGGTEFINQTLKNFCAKEGIELHHPPARTPQLNAVSERNVRSGKDAGRTLLMHAGLPERFGPFAVAHANYVWNRTHVPPTTGKTPFEVMLKRKPCIKHLGVFGCDAYYHVPKIQRGETFNPTMLPGIYLGHDHIRNCAMVHDLRTGELIYTRDVEFLDRRFTHAAALVAGGEQLQQVLSGAGYTRDNNPTAVGEGPDILFDDGPDSIDDASDSGVFDVECITGKRVSNGVTEYCVKWVGYNKTTWEPAGNVEEGARQAIEDYEAAQELVEDRAAAQPAELAAAGPAAAAAAAEPEARSASDSASQADSQNVSEPAVVVSGDDAAAAAPAVAEPAGPRRSPRGHASSASLAFDAGQHHVQMAMSAICSALPGGDDRLSDTDMQLAFAVADGLSLLEDQTPGNWKEAMASPEAAKWRAAADKEMAGCEQMGVWELVPRSDVPKCQVIIPCKWVFKIKVDSSGAVDVYKARLTPKGFMQILGINYSETFAATGKYKSMRLGLALTAACDHELDQMDVPQAFLNANVDEEVYMELPEGYRTGREHLVCKLKKSLYGLKQAPRNWYLLVSKFVVEELGYKATVSDPCLFYKRSKTGRLMKLFLFVDDFQTSYHREDKVEWDALKAKLVERFKTKDLGPSTWILGMRITRDRKARTITLDQELYITKALERYGMDKCKPVSTPGVCGARDAVEEAAADSGPVDRQLYQEMVGTLMYSGVACRLDTMYSVQKLAQAMQAPMQSDMMAAKRLFRYLAGTKDIGLVFGSHAGDLPRDTRGRCSTFRLDVCAFADADWANSKADRKSITGWVAKVNGDPISWASKKQRTVAQSTCEAELYAEAAAIQEVLWLRGLLQELGLHVQTGSLVHGDNQSTLAISKNGIKGERTKHVDVKYHFITETVESGAVQLKWIPTTEQQADLLTKALPTPVFEHFRKQLMTR